MSFVKLNTGSTPFKAYCENTIHRISNRRIQSLVYFLNFNSHMVWCLHFLIKDMHEAFEIYPCYPPKMEDNFTHNAK